LAFRVGVLFTGVTLSRLFATWFTGTYNLAYWRTSKYFDSKNFLRKAAGKNTGDVHYLNLYRTKISMQNIVVLDRSAPILLALPISKLSFAACRIIPWF
jgi:hypothetical protein